MESNEAVKVFLERVSIRAYKSAIEQIDSLLRGSQDSRISETEDIHLHDWYEKLDDETKIIVRAIIKKTAQKVLFGFLVILDNLTMGYPIEGVISDFALYIQTYVDKTSHSNDQPKEAIRINHPKNTSSLHDLIFEFI